MQRRSDRYRLGSTGTSPLPVQASVEGFALLEALVAAAVVAVAVLGTVAAFNLMTTSMNKTASTTKANAAIDRDVAKIKRLALEYTSCVVPAGSVPAAGACKNDAGQVVLQNQSNYYFPMSSLTSEQDKFFAACNSGVESSHITRAFVVAIDSLSAPGEGVTRAKAARESGTDAKNHNVFVDYSLNGRSVRLIKVSPAVSAWCG